MNATKSSCVTIVVAIASATSLLMCGGDGESGTKNTGPECVLDCDGDISIADGSGHFDGSTDGASRNDASTLRVDDGGYFNSEFALSVVGSVAAAGAGFSEPLPLADTCPVVAAGDCVLFDCGGGQVHGYSTDSDTAGALTVSGGTPTDVVTLSLQPDHAYEGFAADASVFMTGTTVTFANAGAAVPAFNQTLTLPSLPTLTSPMISSGTLTIDRATDFSMTWSGGNADVVGVTILRGNKQIACEFPSSASSGVIPSELLAHLSTGSAPMSFLAYAKTIADAGPYVVRFQAGLLLDSGSVTATLN